MPFETTDVASKVGSGNQFDLGKTLGEYAQVQNAFNQNKAFQAENLAGQYLAQATGPDGTPDLGQFAQSIQNDKRTGPRAREFLAAAQALHGAGLTNTGQELTNQQSGLAIQNQQYKSARDVAANAKAAAIVNNSKPGSVFMDPDKAAATALTQGLTAGLFEPKIVSSMMGNGDFGNTTDAAILSGAGGSGPQEVISGTPTSENIGNVTKNLIVNKYTRQANEMSGNAATLQNTTPPAVLASPVSVVNSDGSKSQHILGDYLNPDNTWKSGKEPPLIDAGPLSNAARGALGAAYGPQIANFESEVAAAPNTKNLIEQMRTATDQFQTGPNSGFWRTMGELANEYHIPWDPNNLSKTSAAEVFNKIVPSLLRQQATMLGMNETDTGRQIAAASIPSNELTDVGIKKVLGMVEGNTDAIIASGKLWSKTKDSPGQGPGSYGNFKMDFSRKVPPSIFQSQYMSLDELKDMQKGWSATQKADWQRRRDIAKSQGWLPNAQ